MDFGVTSFDNLAYSNIKNGSFVSANGAESKKLKWCGSGFLKQERTLNEDVFMEFKSNETSNSGNFIEGQQQMLSFSSPNSQTVTWPYLQHISSPFGKNTGVRGHFLTPAQWIELEHQALIYKYITANVPVPSCLLIPIRKALESAGFSSFSGLKPSAFGWGGFHLGFSSSTDPEPGRCRRTDGKKWRCARDAVADQKYCERHMNRGRHRSRKPVEGQTGHSAATIITISGKVVLKDSSKSEPAAPAGSASNALRLSHGQKLHSMELGIPNIHVNRCVPEKENAKGVVNRHTTILSIATSGTSLKENQFNESSPRSEFGLVLSDSLLNPLDRSSPIVNCGNHSTSDDINDQEEKSRNPLQQFINNWPKNHSEPRSTFSWPEHLDLQPDGTQLSISIPVVTSDFMSPTLSPSKNELQANRMDLGFGKIIPSTEENRIQANWIPISWEGGPLGEALNTTNHSSLESKNAKALNLIESQDNSPRSAFGSLSNSS